MKLSRQTKETIKTIVVLILVALFITTYAIYPLNNSDTLFARTDIETYNADSLAQNDFRLFSNPNWQIDSFRVEPDGLTSLASLSIVNSKVDSIRGTVILIPSENKTRDSLLPLIDLITNSSFKCITYDQRATGLSSGKYHGFGSLEATDLQELIGYLEIHSELIAPLYVIGEGLGADAALLCALDEKRIKKIIAIEPYLTTNNFIEIAKIKHNSIWFPFYNSVMLWWYDKNAGYAPPNIGLENITAVACQTVLMTNKNNEEVLKLKEISDSSLLIVENNDSILPEKILTYILH